MFVLLFGPALRVLFNPDQSAASSGGLQELLGDKLTRIYSFFLGEPTSEGSKGLGLQLPEILLALAFLRTLVHALHYYLWQTLAERISSQLRLDLVRRFLHLDPDFRSRKQQGKLEEQFSGIVSNDVTFLREYIAHIWGAIPRDVLLVIVLCASLVYLSPKLSAISFGVLPSAFILRRFGKKLTERSKLALDDYGQMVEWIQKRARY